MKNIVAGVVLLNQAFKLKLQIMKTQTQSKWAINYEYTEVQLNKLVRGTDKPYQFCLIDYYGNKTSYFSINAEQFEAIGDILKKL